jgi:hypothetical protein
MTTMDESRTPQKGQQHSYKVNPPVPVGCEIEWSINGQNAGQGATIGGLKVVGFGGTGEMSVEVTDDVSKTTVTAVIRCPGAPPDIVGPMHVGSGHWPPNPVPQEIVPPHPHKPPDLPMIPAGAIQQAKGGAIILVLAYGLIYAGDALIQVIHPDPSFKPIDANFCTYYVFDKEMKAGERARIVIDNNEHPASGPGAVEIFVTPPGGRFPPAGNPAPRTTFGGDGESTVSGPGIVTVHLKTQTPPPRIRVWIES